MLVDLLESLLISPIDRMIDQLLPNGNRNALVRWVVFVPLLFLVFLPVQMVEMLFESLCLTLTFKRPLMDAVDRDGLPCQSELRE